MTSASADASTTDPNRVFTAALQNDLQAIKALVPGMVNAATPEGYTPLSLSTSAGHLEIVRVLLREGATVDAQDQSGVTALMHACMHGYSEIADLLLLHGANVDLHNKDNTTAIGLAARYGRPGALGALFRANASLVEARDNRGRTAMHWAVLSKHAPTVRYLLGRWRADVTAVDHDGNTPLHHAADSGMSMDIVLLLYHGTATAPSLTALNYAGQTPAQACDAAGAKLLAETLHPAADSKWLSASNQDHRLFSFLRDSPLRQPPASRPPRTWVASIALQSVLIAATPCIPPKLIAHGLTLSWSLIAAGITWVGAMAADAVRATVLARKRGSEATVTRPADGTGTGAGASSPPVTPQMGARSQVNAALLLGSVASAGYIHIGALLAYSTAENVVPGALTVLFLAGYWVAYAHVQCNDPGLIPGADPEHAASFWAAVERLPPGHTVPEGFCERSEMRRPPRAAYSKLCGGLIRCMDHDCPWVARCIGQGNHFSFVAMLLCGEIALTLWLITMYYAPPPPPYRSWMAAAAGVGVTATDTEEALCATRRAAQLAFGVPLAVLLHILLTPLLFSQLWMVTANVTTREHFHWVSYVATQKDAPNFPLRGSRFWSEYAPYDKGVRRNIIEFVRGTRDGAAAAMDLDGESEGSQTLHTEGMPPLDAAPDPHVYGV